MMPTGSNVNSLKKPFRILRKSKYYHIVHVDHRPKSKIRYESTTKTKLWGLYGKVVWQPLQGLIRRSINTFSNFKYRNGLKRKFLPHFKSDEMDCKWVLLEKWSFDMPPAILYVMFGWMFYGMKEFYLKHSYKIHNYEYKKKFYWYRPFIYISYMIMWIYRSDYTCCGYRDHICDEDDYGAYEVINSGSTGTMDGTDHWSYGYIHCSRCNTPVWFSESSL